jgi:tetratricopeptide (TPR) repeat protein
LDAGDWEDYYIRGVNLANQRGDTGANRAALLAYSNAIALAPVSLPSNLRSRLYAYRAALYKRLNRLEEAEQDLALAQRWATERREIEDALYNLACVLAMGANPQSALPVLRQLLEQNGDWARIVSAKPRGEQRRDWRAAGLSVGHGAVGGRAGDRRPGA